MSVGPLHHVPRSTDPPQFRLRTLFIVVTLFGMLFGVMHTLGPVASVVVVMVLLTVGLHMAGNALGTSRRDESTERFGERVAVDQAQLAQRCEAVKAGHRLRERTPLGWVIRVTTILGSAGGISLGVVVLKELTRAELPGLIFGAMSAGVLGGFFGFLGGSFLEITRRAWWQATCESREDERVTR
jgi:hypothetical protein